MSSTRRHCTPGGVALACLHEAVQVWQPTQRRRSATIAQRVMAHSRPARLILTRTMSAPEPVASVSSIDIVASEFMLGTPKSLANGVAQWSNWPISSSVSGRMPWRTTARPCTLRCGVDDLDRVAVGDAQPLPPPSC